MKPYIPSKTCFIFLFSLLYTNAFAQDDVTAKANKLRSIYAAFENATDETTFERQFFDAFPGSFAEFVALYGYENSPAVLYHQGLEHLRLFNNIRSVNDTVYYKKLISLAIGGRWEADAVNDLQDGLRKRVLGNTELAVFHLRQHSPADVGSFWYFYFDEPHPAEQIDTKLEMVKVLDKGMYAALKQMHEKAVGDNKH